MTKRNIQQRKRIFIAGEGESEQSFVKWLQNLSDQKKLHLHLDCHALDGGGYRAMLERAVRERGRKERFKAKFSILLVDGDRADRGDDSWSLLDLRREALARNIRVSVQHPNLEGRLLRMLPDKERLQPSGAKALSQLCVEWPNYQKPADASTLAAKFSLDDLLRVARFDAELKELLILIGLMRQSR